MRASFVFSEVVNGLRRNVTMTIAMILTTAISVGLLGGGMLVGGVVMGKLLDAEYQRVKRKMIRKLERDPENKVNPADVTKEEHFPIEYARLRSAPPFFAVYVIAAIGYGWCLHSGVNLAGPLILLIVSKYLRYDCAARVLF